MQSVECKSKPNMLHNFKLKNRELIRHTALLILNLKCLNQQ